MKKWKTVKLFISSTFSDMHAERNALIKEVFPSLRKKLLAYRIHLVEIDLRWGVTQEQLENNEVIKFCLEQIDECRPFFLGILGQRYGWVPWIFRLAPFEINRHRDESFCHCDDLPGKELKLHKKEFKKNRHRENLSC